MNSEDITEQLVNALAVVMDVSVPQERRLQANQFLEEFKNTSNRCAYTGICLTFKDRDPIVRHFGLLLIEHSIKFQWNHLSLEDKLFVKEKVMEIMSEGTNDLLAEQYYIKNALVKNVVEIIKREWPQQWPGMLQELHSLTELGATQKELVLLVFLRLVEDVVVLQNFENKRRRRDIYQGLTTNMQSVFGLIATILIDHFTIYQNMKCNLAKLEPYQVNVNRQLVAASLVTISEFVDWVDVSHLLHNDGILVKVFCLQLLDEQLRIKAIDCLLKLISRNKNSEDRQAVLCLFTEDNVASVLKSIGSVCYNIEEDDYTFVKRVCQLLSSLGSQLCVSWTLKVSTVCPWNFRAYLQATLELTMHPSQVLSGIVVPLWVQMLKHEYISKNELFVSVLQCLVEALLKKLIKVGLPSQNDSLSSTFSSLDFDSDEDFSLFFAQTRVVVVDALRFATILAPAISSSCVLSWLQAQLQKPPETAIDYSKIVDVSENLLGYQEWNALAVGLDCVFGRLDLTKNSLNDEAIKLLQQLLSYKTEDPHVLSSILSCILAMFAFVSVAPQVLPSVLDRMFLAVVFTLPCETHAKRSKVSTNVRRHACSCLAKICKITPQLLLPSFDMLYQRIFTLGADWEQITKFEHCILIESLIMISNQFQDFENQRRFIQDVCMPATHLLLKPEVQKVVSSIEFFASFIGLDKPLVESSIEDESVANRTEFTYCVNMILATVKRSLWPGDLETAKKGGFVRHIPNYPNQILCNPAAEFILPLIESVCRVLRLLMLFSSSEVLSKFPPEYSKANDLPTVDKNSLLGLILPCIDSNKMHAAKPPLDRMQRFFTSAYESCCQILGSAGPNLGHAFYCHSNLVDGILLPLFVHLNVLPDHRFRPFIRLFLKPYVQSCPQDLYPTAVIPILTAFCPFMHERLNAKWIIFDKRLEEKRSDDDDANIQEILEDELHRQLTREYIDLLLTLLRGKNVSSALTDTEDMMEEDDALAKWQSGRLSDYGQLVLKTPNLYPFVVLTIFSALSWNDAATSLKSVVTCLPCIKMLLEEHVLGCEEAKHLFGCILLGLKQHGEHDSNATALVALGLQSYEILRPLYPELTSVLLQIPNCTAKDVTNFDDALFTKQLPERKKKGMFRSLVSGIINVGLESLGKLFSNKILIKNLPPIFKRTNYSTRPSLVDDTEDDIGLCRMFNPVKSELEKS